MTEKQLIKIIAALVFILWGFLIEGQHEIRGSQKELSDQVGELSGRLIKVETLEAIKK